MAATHGTAQAAPILLAAAAPAQLVQLFPALPGQTPVPDWRGTQLQAAAQSSASVQLRLSSSPVLQPAKARQAEGNEKKRYFAFQSPRSCSIFLSHSRYPQFQSSPDAHQLILCSCEARKVYRLISTALWHRADKVQAQGGTKNQRQR